MQEDQMQWNVGPVAVAQADVQTRANFISRTYSHLFGAVMAFCLIEFALFSSGIADRIAPTIAQNWWIVLGAFVILGMVASKMATKVHSPAAQYAALFGFVALEALIFVPILWIAHTAFPGVITTAALVTVVGFTGLTAIAFVTRKDFSFMGSMLRWAGFLLIGMIIASIFINAPMMHLAIAVLAIGLAGASILYDTSNVLHHYPENMHVAASLSLFASVAMMFYYVIYLLISLQSD